MTMKTILSLCGLLAAGVTLAASPPPLMNYQGVLRDAAGTPLDGTVDMVMRFWSAPAGGDEILVDHHTAAFGTAVQVDQGLFRMALGGGLLADGAGAGTYDSLSEVFSDYGEVYIGVQVAGDAEMTPRMRVLSTAHALNADRLDGKDASEFAVADHEHTGQYLDVAGGSLSGSLSLPANGLEVGGSQLALSGGSVGVGTSTPASRLHVAGGGLLVDGGATSSPISLNAGHAPGNGQGGAVTLSAGGGYNDRGGHVSLQGGTTSSWSSFGNSSDVWLRGGDVDGQVSFAEVRVQGGRAVAGGTTRSDGGVVHLRGGDATGVDRSGGNVVLIPGSATGSGVPGRVGVGTLAPQSLLHVAGDLRADGRLISTVAQGTAPISVASTTTVNGLSADLLDGFNAADFALTGHDHGSEYLGLAGGSLAGALSLPANGLEVGGSQFAVSGGSVGVGTSSPSNRLHVQGGGLTVDGGSSSNAISLTAGSAPSNGLGGNVEILAGGGYNDRGGHVTVQSGNTSSWSSLGGSSDVWLRGGTVDGQSSFAEIRIQGGRAVAGGTTHSDGGALTFRAGDATGSNRNGGDIVLTPGAATGSGAAGRVGVGTASPQAPLHVAGGDLRVDGRLVSTVTTGTAPLAVASTTRVDGLNADLLDGLSSNDFARNTDLHTRYTDAEALSAMGAKGDGNPLHHDRPTASAMAEAAPRLRRIALRKWYAAGEGVEFPTGSGPHGVLFDGAHVWVANRYADTVTKLRASDGETLGTFAVGLEPMSLAYDGANVWVGNHGGGSVTKLRGYDGAVLDTVALGTRVDDVEFDGMHLWVAHGDLGGTISKLRASDGALLATYGSGGSCPIALEFDGSDLWIANWCGSGVVSRMRPADGVVTGTYPVFTCNDLAFDGEHVWVTSGNDDVVVKLRASDGANLGSHAVGTSPAGVTFDGTHVWVANSGDDTVTRLRVSDGSVSGTHPTGGTPLRIAFDGAAVWITGSADDTVRKH